MNHNGYTFSGIQLAEVAGMQNVYPWPADNHMDEHVLVLTSSDNNLGGKSD